MNYSPITSAYNIDHVNTNTYRNPVEYDKKCIFCPSTQSEALLQDGSFRKCSTCRKHFKATIMSTPISNYKNSTGHLMPFNNLDTDPYGRRL